MASKPLPPAALLSVTDKTGIVEFAKSLRELGYVLLSTGGTAKLLAEAGLPVVPVSEFTGSDEILDGRVKTLHPKVHASIMWDRSNPQHQSEMNSYNGSRIDIVAVNLYNFRANALGKDLSVGEAIEYIDIGGPTMLRAAAKNHAHCLPVIEPRDYAEVIEHLRGKGCDTSLRQRLAAKVFAHISRYDAMIASYLGASSEGTLPQAAAEKTLRYGENPHQTASVHAWKANQGLAGAEPLQGKELSYNNYLDLDAALKLGRDLSSWPATVIIKHNNPCGVAISSTQNLEESFHKALACDPVSAFGSVISFTRRVEKSLAQTLNEKLFVECIIAPDFSDEALTFFAQKKNLRLVRGNFEPQPSTTELRTIDGGYLTQTADDSDLSSDNWKVVTKKEWTAQQKSDLTLANIVAKHVKSNTLVFVKNGQTLGIGAGQMSRIDAAKIAVRKAAEVFPDVPNPLAGTVMASDAFFPFRDTVDYVAGFGVQAIVQPGGSMRDQESIDACNEHGIAMIFTGTRHFRH